MTAWIEIFDHVQNNNIPLCVAVFMTAWIEIPFLYDDFYMITTLQSS